MAARVKLPEITVHEHSILLSALTEKLNKINDEMQSDGIMRGSVEWRNFQADATAVKELIERLT